MKHPQTLSRIVLICAVGAVVVSGHQVSAQSQGPKPLEAVVVNVPSQPVPTVAGAGVTHLGVPLDDHVMLVAVSRSAGSPCFPERSLHRISSDGSVEAAAFAVPAGRSLVVLDVDAVIVTNDLSYLDVGDSVGASLVTPSNINTGLYMTHTTSGVLITVPNMKAVSISSKLAAGVVFGPGQQVCLRPEVRSFGGGFSPNGEIVNGAVRGYLR